MAETEKHIYRWGVDADGNDITEADASMKYIVGGKGANLAEMAKIGLPVPPGFSITCQTCVAYSGNDNTWPEGVLDEIDEARIDLEERMGKKLGDAEDPLLVSVRSGAPFSMPGMMDTVLNLGLNDESVKGLIAKTDNPRFGWDSYRRFIQMFSNVVMGVDSDLFENAINQRKLAKGVKNDTDLTAEDLEALVEQFKVIFSENVDTEAHPEILVDGVATFPQDPYLQLKLAIEAVFGSWMNERAILYRQQNKIPDDLGTAVNVQIMAYGNKGNDSATGVAFTRNPADGTKEFYGDFLVNAQGEDVVAGIRNTEPISDLKTTPGLEPAGEELEKIFGILEDHYRDMMDIEFTIENGKLWMLQTRVGKRTALAALHVAIDMVNEGRISKAEAVQRVEPAQLDQLLHPQIDPGAELDVLASGLNASPGAAVGEVVFSSADAVEAAAEGRPCILVRWETNPDDLKGMVAAEGILTSHGGKTSHAAVIARGMGAPCVCGVEALKIDAAKKEAKVSGTDVTLHEGDVITIDGTTGRVVLGAVELVQPELAGDLETILEWADEISNDETLGRKMGVRANADNPDDAKLSLEFGATGIGLCRTEHMFLGERKQIIQSFILADDEDTKKAALDQLLEAQEGDFLQMLETMSGHPMIIRLLDPPLHEFLDSPRELAVEIAKLEALDADPKVIAEKSALLARIDAMSEANPMLGLRGCRLGIMYPELTDLQTKAIGTATAELIKKGLDPKPEIMIPLVSTAAELEAVRAQVEGVLAEVAQETGVELDIPVGTMIELPRAALEAEEIGRYADFFSFGTNDLTQTTFGFSRDDVESAFIPTYLRKKLLKTNPFETLDAGVAKLVDMGVKGGHAAHADIVCGVCGETGGDPDSIHMYYDLGLDYVSCSPYRVPIARLTAAQAKLAAKGDAVQRDK
ncbi:pyruvate, phosphate dikinase [Olsenella sp. YH-ols2217]|uniref:Pyruvate, phosphate dikinase n=1 Tax=Kribbibacterium absianum TaxID=3044210 RepID=A0ABT6ZIZ0_9ACTN|nr:MULTISPECIES: pyruvate, phosphate dikinase [unclassified Olsenella]MDJ1121529.1 pyruvate, phosphate dikinase [Olsenella sp. YH-ols2216]MDJ1129019.1 pyruvate, phosphate dikinase [Olsenella sp. YH-ols2217]